MDFNLDDQSLKTRILGLILFCAGIITAYLNHQMRTNSGEYYPMFAFLAPLLIAFGIICVVETPELPYRKPSVFGWICIVTASLIGFWNAF